MIRLILLLLFFITTQSVQSQEGWYQQNSGTTNNLKSVFFTDENTGYAVGYNGTILKTTNGGFNWTAYTGVPNEYFRSVHFSGQTGFIVGGYNSAIIFKTTDGGDTWADISTFANYGLYGVFLTGASNVHICGDGKIMRSTNGGFNWQIQNFDSTGFGIYRDFRAIYFTDSQNGFTGGNTLWVGHYTGLVRVTNNGGVTWSQTGSQPSLTSIYFINTLTGYGTASSYGSCCPTNYIYKTSTGGGNWTFQVVDSNSYFNSIRFHNSSTGYVAGFTSAGASSIFKTTTNGINWFKQYSPPADSLNSIFLINAFTGYAVGNQGTILKTTNGGVTSVYSLTNEIPDKFKLYQNYPNPFNPSTVIRFDIPKNSNVKLSVFDVTGKEMSNLVNGHLQPGSYEYRLDGGGFPSGVYFYKLDNGNAVETKRMVLLK